MKIAIIGATSFVGQNLMSQLLRKKIDMNGENPNNFEPNSFWGDNSKLKKIIIK